MIEVNELFKTLNDINPNHIKLLEIYAGFLTHVSNDDQAASKYYEKLSFIMKTTNKAEAFGVSEDNSKAGDNENTIVATLSGNPWDRGMVLNINNEIKRVLNFDKKEIIGGSIEKLMPKIIGELHDSILDRFFSTSKPLIINTG